MVFKSSVSLLIFCLDARFLIQDEVSILILDWITNIMNFTLLHSELFLNILLDFVLVHVKVLGITWGLLETAMPHVLPGPYTADSRDTNYSQPL